MSRPLSVSADDGASSSDASDETVEGQEAPEPGASDQQVEYWGFDYDEEPELVTRQGPFNVFLMPRQAPTPIGAEPPLVLAAQEACSPLEAVLARGAATANLCVEPVGLTADASMQREPLGVAKAAGLIARQRWSQGRQSDALSILENGFLVVRDYRSGAVSWIGAMISVAAERILGSHYASLLVGVVDLSTEEVELHRERLALIRESAPSPAAIPYFDHVLNVSLIPASTDPIDRLSLVASMSRQSCGEDDPSPLTCLERWEEERASVDGMELPGEVWVRRLFRSLTIESVRARESRSSGSCLSRIVDADIILAALSDLLRVSVARDTCPPSIDFEDIEGTVGLRQMLETCYPRSMPRRLRVRMRTALTLAMVVLVGGCTDDDALTLRVDLKTDFVPGAEFDAVRLRVGDGDLARISDHLVDGAMNYVRGARLNEADVNAGQVPVTVTLVRAGEPVISRRAVVSVSALITVATVVITRNCEGIACPNDNPAFDSCLGGRCVDPRCTVETPEFCPPPECTTDAACASSVACAEALCQDDVCLSVPRDSNCASGERCDAADGCVVTSTRDAGMTDGAVAGDASDSGPFDSGSGSDTFYISPTGSDDSPGTRSEPVRTFSRALDALYPGATLILLDGEYGSATGTGLLDIDCGEDATSCDGAACASGTVDMPITIFSESQRGAVIRVDVGDAPSANNVSIRDCENYVVGGLTMMGRDNVGAYPMIIAASANITLRDSLLAQNNRAENTHLLAINDSRNVLVEDNEFYDFHRYAIASWRSRNVTVRRNYIDPRGRTDIAGGFVSASPTTGDSGFACHHSARCLAENNVFIGAARHIEVNTALPFLDGGGGGGDGSRIVANFFSGGEFGVLAGSSCERMPLCASVDERVISGLHIQNNVFFSQRASAVLIRGVEALVVRNNSAFDGEIRVDRLLENESLACSAAVFNNLVRAQETGITLVQQDTWSVDGNNTFPGNIFTDNLTGLGTNGRLDPAHGGCFHRVPSSSPVNGTGRDGEDIGARLVERYEGGLATAETLWSATGSFPCGAIVEGVNDGVSDCNSFRVPGIGGSCSVE